MAIITNKTSLDFSFLSAKKKKKKNPIAKIYPENAISGRVTLSMHDVDI